MTDFWRIAASLGVPGLALGIFYMLFRGASKQWPISRKWTPLILALWMVLIGGLVFFALLRFSPEHPGGPQVYQVRVIVLSPTGQPVEDAKVWSARGGEAKKVAGGWEIELPAAKRAADGQLTLFATQGDLDGGATVTLGSETLVTGTIQLNPPKAVALHGIVLDETSQPLEGVRVSLEGSGAETVTAANGEFHLPPQPKGDAVFVRAEKTGYSTQRTQFQVQGEPFHFQLKKEGA